jgi:tetratricopeptide (TPR) repeat protein
MAPAFIAEGDAAFFEKDYRAALHSYQDAAQADPRSVEALVKIGHAQSKLGYDDAAIEQYQRALAIDPNNSAAIDGVADARARLARRAGAAAAPAGQPKVVAVPVADAGTPAAPPAPTGPSIARSVAVPAAPSAPAAAASTQAAGAGAAAAGAGAAAAGASAPTAATSAPAAAAAPAAPTPAAGAAAAPSPKAAEAARQHYVVAVDLINKKQFADAIGELDQALAWRPGYAVALIARGSAKIGLQQFKSAAADYEAAHAAAPNMAAPIFGLAEARRMLGEKELAADLYRQFAESTAPDATEPLKAYARRTAEKLLR